MNANELTLADYDVYGIDLEPGERLSYLDSHERLVDAVWETLGMWWEDDQPWSAIVLQGGRVVATLTTLRRLGECDGIIAVDEVGESHCRDVYRVTYTTNDDGSHWCSRELMTLSERILLDL